ncbi:hypothetical protein, conserved [Eimeria tenella]|uniref:TB2/DP1, HVA22 domain-containing protein n=1 Tax=Eimeria tenella TaxID=5802 RepID=U6L201_EIMTE|nr:hypothetical protein, conserved [Eimeria tenella]CDJ41800.1 hypothetical protein, conserved [Eimeria tenella]|eukprot:XP_013232550.1 hypothetical protein, conserved [Eimeria tenella]
MAFPRRGSGSGSDGSSEALKKGPQGPPGAPGAPGAPGGWGPAGALQRLFSEADKYLQDAPVAQQAAAATGLRPSFLVAVAAAVLFISLGTGFGGGLVCDIAGFLYPAWMSFLAIESPGTEGEKLWLTYWVVYSAFSILEYFVDFILFWIPFYYLFKFCFLLYLALPRFKGAETIYNLVIRPLLLQQQQPLQQLAEAGNKAAAELQQKVLEGINKVQGAVSVAGGVHTPQVAPEPPKRE